VAAAEEVTVVVAEVISSVQLLSNARSLSDRPLLQPRKMISAKARSRMAWMAMTSRFDPH
jgi:hypothetical protein